MSQIGAEIKFAAGYESHLGIYAREMIVSEVAIIAVDERKILSGGNAVVKQRHVEAKPGGKLIAQRSGGLAVIHHHIVGIDKPREEK